MATDYRAPRPAAAFLNAAWLCIARGVFIARWNRNSGMPAVEKWGAVFVTVETGTEVWIFAENRVSFLWACFSFIVLTCVLVGHNFYRPEQTVLNACEKHWSGKWTIFIYLSIPLNTFGMKCILSNQTWSCNLTMCFFFCSFFESLLACLASWPLAFGFKPLVLHLYLFWWWLSLNYGVPKRKLTMDWK